jgi:hypothetical protein
LALVGLNRLTLWQRALVFHASLLLALLPAHAAIPSDDIAAGVRQAVLGIMSFTRWPTPTSKVRLCVVGQPGYAGALFGTPMRFGDTPVAVSRRAVQGGDLGEQCDAIYAGAMADPERETLRRQLRGHPVLTMTEDDPQCSGHSMFCLDTAGAGAQVGFAVNLDSVARSGVAVNPRVLLLGRRRKSLP